MGPHCSTAFLAMYQWAGQTRPTLPAVGISYIAFPALMAGVISLLRASGKGRCGWEPATVFFLACLPPFLMPILGYNHPQDLLATGLTLGTIACAIKGKWGCGLPPL
jgi:hypothetical protein